MRILISGSHGFIGSAVKEGLRQDGHEVVSLVRGQAGADEVGWNPTDPAEDVRGFEGFDAVIHLAGESLMGRWTPGKKAAIRYSRVLGTRHLCGALANTQNRPRVLLCASASGYYGDRGDEILDETCPAGGLFLSGVCGAWEEAAGAAAMAGIRVVNMRISMVLDPAGGALGQMLPVFRLGLGGDIGRGRQWWSWISRREVVNIMRFLLENEDLSGPVNVTVPNPVRNEDFSKILGRTLGRWTAGWVPSAMARLIWGQMAEEIMLSSVRMVPRKLEAAGYVFREPELEGALKRMLR